MRRITQVVTLALLVLVALPTGAALAAEPNAVDDPPAAFDDGVAGVAGDEGVVAEETDDQSNLGLEGIPEATVEEDAPDVAAQNTAPVATANAAAAPVASSGQLPFTGIDSGLIPVISLFGSLLLIGGALLYIVAGTRRADEPARS